MAAVLDAFSSSFKASHRSLNTNRAARQALEGEELSLQITNVNELLIPSVNTFLENASIWLGKILLALLAWAALPLCCLPCTPACACTVTRRAFWHSAAPPPICRRAHPCRRGAGRV